nr:DNA translocase FtsK [Aliagarivorans taiwanensis]
MYAVAVQYVRRSRRARISGLQRQLRIGFNRAARLMEALEADGFVSQPDAEGLRTVIPPASSTWEAVDLIDILSKSNSKLEFEPPSTGFSFPCCICKHSDEPNGTENGICNQCVHAY